MNLLHVLDCLPVIFSVEVGDEDLDDGAMIVQQAHSQAFTSKPIPVQDLVGEPVERKLMEGRVNYRSSGEDAGAATNDPVIKEVSVGQDHPKQRLY